jgi:DNA-binding GntR family transcriptional regulator
LLRLLEERWGVTITNVRSTLRAVTSDPALAARVGADPTVAWILIEQVNADQDGKPVVYSKDYHRGDYLTFHVMCARR